MYNSDAQGITVSGGRNLHLEMPAKPLPQTISTGYDLEAWRAEHAAAALQVTDLENERRRSLARATVQSIREMDDKIITARVRTERAAAVIADAEERFAAAAARESAAQPERWAKHDAGLKARDEAERLMREVYGPAAVSIGACLTRLVALEAEIDAANRYLPQGADRIPSPDVFRGYPGIETHYVDQDETYYVDPATGYETRPTTWSPKVLGVIDHHRTVELVARTRTKRVKQQGRAAYVPNSLAREVALPGLLHGDGPIWPVRS